MEELKPYTVLKPLHHNNKAYRIGRTVGLTDEQAVSLLKLGVVAIGEPELVSVASPLVLGRTTLAAMTVGELQSYAVSHGVELAGAATKKEILTAIETKLVPEALVAD